MCALFYTFISGYNSMESKLMKLVKRRIHCHILMAHMTNVLDWFTS